MNPVIPDTDRLENIWTAILAWFLSWGLWWDYRRNGDDGLWLRKVDKK